MYKVIITLGDFLSPKEFIERYTQNGIKVIIEDIEAEGTDDVHTSGYTERKLKSKDKQAISKELQEIYIKESLRGECLGVYLDTDDDLENEIFTENDF